MTRVDFYILQQDNPNDGQQLACRVAEKAYSQGNRVYVHTADAQQAEHIDQLLWTFRAGSFVPHARIDDNSPEAEVPVLIGHGTEPRDHDDVLINLSPEVPLFFSRFHRVAEIISNDEEAKKLGRERFRFYRERGYPLNTHEL